MTYRVIIGCGTVDRMLCDFGKILAATNGASFELLIDDKVSGFLCYMM